MRVLLIQSPLGRREPLIYPSALAALAAAIPDHQVRGFDPNLFDHYAAPLRELIESWRPEVVGISLRNIDTQMMRDLYYYLPPFQQCLRLVRALLPEAPIVVGGAGFSLFPEKIMARTPELDFGIFLEGERTFPALLAALDTPDEVPGLFLRREGRIIFTGKQEFSPLASIPEPDYGCWDPSPYIPIRGAVGVQSRRGCPLRCAYCTYPKLNGRTIRMRPAGAVADELERLVTDHGLRHFSFLDAVFNLPSDYTAEMLAEMERRGIRLKWNAWFHESGLDEAFIRRCLRLGCDEFSFSPDGISDPVLSALDKDIHASDVENVFRLLARIDGMRASFSFFINAPGTTPRSFLRLIRLFLQHKVLSPGKVAGFMLAIPRLEPETAIYQRALREGMIDPDRDLLPERSQDLTNLFYRNPNARYAERFFTAYTSLWNLRRSAVKPGAETMNPVDMTHCHR